MAVTQHSSLISGQEQRSDWTAEVSPRERCDESLQDGIYSVGVSLIELTVAERLDAPAPTEAPAAALLAAESLVPLTGVEVSVAGAPTGIGGGLTPSTM